MKTLGRFLFVCLLGLALTVSAEPKKLLVVTVTKGFRHSSIPTAEKVLGELAEKTGDFTVEYVRQSEGDKEVKEKMTMENIRKFDGVIFANTTGDLPVPDKEAFLNWIRSGKAFIGMHSATDTYRGHQPLDPYIQMVGAEFKSHPPGLYDVQCIVHDGAHPSCKHLGPIYKVKDEIYLLNGYERSTVHELLTLDKHPADRSPGHYPVSWCKKYGKGNMFYTSLGHAEAVWESPEYQKHILGGIRWALGLEQGDATPQTQK